MTTTRRELFRLGLGGSTLLACGTTVPAFLARSALALADGAKREAGGPILVVIQLDGGNDGLNTVVPHGDDIYHKSRPKLALKAKDLKPIDEHIGLHPSLEKFAKLRAEGRLAIVQSVGYPNPNRSHFESMAIWQTARLHPGQEEPGWLARAVELGTKGQGGDAPGLHIGAGVLPQALRGGKHFVPSLATADQLRRRMGVADPDGADEQRVALDRIAGQSATGENSLLQFVARSTVNSYATSARLDAVLRDREGGDEARLIWPDSPAADDCPHDQGRAVDVDLLHPARWLRHARRAAQPALRRLNELSRSVRVVPDRHRPIR